NRWSSGGSCRRRRNRRGDRRRTSECTRGNGGRCSRRSMRRRSWGNGTATRASRLENGCWQRGMRRQAPSVTTAPRPASDVGGSGSGQLGSQGVTLVGHVIKLGHRALVGAQQPLVPHQEPLVVREQLLSPFPLHCQMLLELPGLPM